MAMAVDRPGFEPGDDLAAWFTEQRRRNPTFQAPAGFEWKGDHYERDTHGFWDDLGKWTAIGGGVGAMGLGGMGLAGIGPLAGSGALGGGGAAFGPGAVDGIGGSVLPGTALGGYAPAPGGSGGILNWLGNNWRDLLGMGGDLGQVLGGAAAGAAQGRLQEGDLLARRDLAKNQQYGINQGAEMQAGNLDLARKSFSEGARGSRAKDALLGNLLQNVQDVNISVPGVPSGGGVTGGLRPSALGAGGRQAGSDLAKQALLAMSTPDAFTGGQVLTPPQLAPIPEASGWETAAGVGGTVGSILGALGGRRRR